MPTDPSTPAAPDGPDAPDHRAPLVVGWREAIALPDWGIDRLRAKLDTGARSSALHVERIEELEDGRIAFDAVVRERPTRRVVRIEATPERTTIVKPSSGVRQKRTVVRTTMRLGTIEREIDVTLVCRRGMLCRMLVGRTALEGVALVDPGRRYLVSRARAPRSPR